MQIVRKFQVYVSEKIRACYADQFYIRPYPVLAINTNSDGEDLVLIVNTKRQFTWIPIDDCTLAIIDE